MNTVLLRSVVIFSLLALVCASRNDSKNEAESRMDTYLKPPQKLMPQKENPYRKEKEKSFMSKLASWLFPFGGSDDIAKDAIPAEGQSRAQYAPPPPHHHQQQQQEKQCSPCNSVPWIPIASNRGAHTLVEFKPPKHLPGSSSHGANFELQQPQLQINYGPPADTYGPPQISSEGYTPPAIPVTNYGVPPPVIPLSHQPQQLHTSLPTDEYGPPPPPIPAGQYGPPIPSSQYGPPQSHDQFIAASQHNLQKEPQSYKQKSPHFKPGNFVKSVTTKPYKYIPVKFMQFPKLELGPKPPQSGPPVPFRLTQPQYSNSFTEVQKIPSLELLQNLQPDNFAAPIDTRPATYVVPPPIPFSGAISQASHFDKNIRGPIIPFPNLSLKPVLPIHNYQNFKTSFNRPFKDNLSQQGAYFPVHTNHNQPTQVQVQSSIPIAGYLASIEHPINVIQSPIVEVTVKEENGEIEQVSTPKNEEGYTKTDFKENPIVVPESDDAHFAETSNNQTTYQAFDVNNKRGNDNSLGIFSFDKGNTRDQSMDVLKQNEKLIKEILATQETTTTTPTKPQTENYTQFTTSPVDYTGWTPSFANTNQSPPDKMMPPLKNPSPWTNYMTKTPTTKKPKQIQVIVPYITNQTPKPFNNLRESHQQLTSSTLKPSSYETLPMYFTPPSQSSIWPDYSQQESQKVFTAHKPSLIQAANIRELLKGEIDSKQRPMQPVPFDIITLQKTIDDWTQQEFSNKLNLRDEPKFTTSNRFAPSKNIPKNFFTTGAYSSTTLKTTSAQYDDHSVASSMQRETKIKKDVTDFESNFIIQYGSSDKPSTVSHEKDVRLSTSKDAVYVVTGKPWNNETSRANVTHKTATFAIRLESDNDTLNSNKTEKVIYSEWPHLINNLQTTAASRHPLLGLMDIPSYTPPPNSTVETYLGHSKVITVVTPASVTVNQTTITNNNNNITPTTAST